MFKYLLCLCLSLPLFAQNTNPTSLIIGIQHQEFATGGNLSIPLHRFNIATSGVHLDAVVKNKQASAITDSELPVQESYSLGYYVDYGRTFVSFGYNYFKTQQTATGVFASGIASENVITTKHGAYAKLGIHGKYIGVFAGYSSASKASFGLMAFIPF